MGSPRRTKLVLGREPLYRLSREELTRVGSGFTDVSHSCFCQSFVCSIGSDCVSFGCKP